jgi:acetoacetyl-CoA synthetase
MSRGAVVWTPAPDAAAGSQLARYMRWLADSCGRAFASYEDLWAWSVDDLEGFWESVWRYFDIRATPYDAVLPDRAMPGARWFVGAQLNYAEHALRAGEADGDRVAVVELDEDGPRGELTWAALRGAVGGVAAGLRERGIGRGDLVTGYLPNCAEAAVAYLACASIGAVWSSCAPDLQPSAALDRFGQLRPAALIACDGYRYGGRAHDRRAAVAELAGGLDSLRVPVVVVDRLGLGGPPGSEPWEALAGAPAQPAFEPLPFDHPLYVLFSSGTTGPPKGIVHGHGGQLLDHVRHHALHVDLGPADRFSFYTGTSWMVWNWLVAGLLVGSTIVLYDGSPRHPELDAQFAVVASAGATVHGTSAGYLTACAKAGLRPGARHDLGALRAIASTGSPLPPDTFHWIRDAVGGHVWPVSTSGGTDVCSAFVSGCPLLGVRAGEIQCRCLGAAIDVLDESGRPLRGEVGELVLTAPLPSMPVRFWDDPDGERYRASYFDEFPGVWRHGDWATLTDDGAIVILGRSDSTLNRHGVRIGTAEVYAAIDGMPEIADSLIIGVEEPDGGYWMALFVALDPGSELDERLRTSILDTIRATASPRHVPDDVVRVPAIPRTHTGKKLEVPIKRLFMGADPATTLNRNAVADPEALDAFVALAARRSRALRA